jgi:putative tryptophan/tyrosine transport system substrate-binding protein
MDRRRFLLTSLAGALVAPLVAEALQAGKVYRIGVLRTSFSPPTPDPHLDALRQGLHALGYVEGKNITLEVRWAEGRSDRFAGLAAELVRLGVDAIVVTHTETALAVMEKTRIIPIVMATSFDAVADGLVVSLARPGGNVTGLSLLIPEMSLKRLELLKQTIPALSRVVVLWTPGRVSSRLVRDHELAARSLGLDSLSLEVRGPDDLDTVFQLAIRKRAGAVVTVQNPLFNHHQTRITELALKNRLPTMSGEPGFAAAGGLMTYGPSIMESFRNAATYVDKTLKGATPGDLPIEQPTKFEFIINLKTARALGLTIPPSLLARADQVIE